LVGPSNISNPCSRCLAEDMLQHEQPESQYTMGAKIGTAIHEALEREALKRPDLTPETKVTIAEVEGYGVIKGTSDLYIKTSKTAAGQTTTTIEKGDVCRTLKRSDRTKTVPEFEPESHTVGRKTITRYTLQADIDGLGVERRGAEVKTVALHAIPRDAKTY